MPSDNEILDKAEKVCRSCKTAHQVKMAMSYCDLAEKQLQSNHSRAMLSLVTSRVFQPRAVIMLSSVKQLVKIVLMYIIVHLLEMGHCKSTVELAFQVGFHSIKLLWDSLVS